jgi:hypothetical protein
MKLNGAKAIRYIACTHLKKLVGYILEISINHLLNACEFQILKFHFIKKSCFYLLPIKIGNTPE